MSKKLSEVQIGGILEGLNEVLDLKPITARLFLSQYVQPTVDVQNLTRQLTCREISEGVGSNTIVAAREGYHVCVYSILIVGSGELDVLIRDTSQHWLTGNVTLCDEAQGYALSVNPPAFIMKSKDSKGIQTYVDGTAVTINGLICYWYEKNIAGGKPTG